MVENTKRQIRKPMPRKYKKRQHLQENKQAKIEKDENTYIELNEKCESTRFCSDPVRERLSIAMEFGSEHSCILAREIVLYVKRSSKRSALWPGVSRQQ